MTVHILGQHTLPLASLPADKSQEKTARIKIPIKEAKIAWKDMANGRK